MWQPLPKRQRFKQDTNTTTNPHRIPASHQEDIDKAISARSSSHRVAVTLDSKDGCAGKNFECIMHI
jgi:hypothetical protein